MAGAPSIEQALDQYITEHRVETIAQVSITYFLPSYHNINHYNTY